MAIPDATIDTIQEKTDIVEVISRYLALKKAGRNYKANCPFHHEKTPSFVVSPDKQIYHCFGCGAGGNVFSFLMRQENIEFPEAVEMLAEKAGIAIPRARGDRQELTSLANQLYKLNDIAAQFFQTSLAGSGPAAEYLRSRGIGAETVKQFRIGYAPDAWDGMINFFKAKGVAASVLEKAGLAISNERGGHYDRFRRRIIFPISDLKDRVLGFGGRVLDTSLPKYINSPETPVYSKGRNLYGLNLSKEHIKREGHALIVEGYLDFLIPYQAGVKNLIATLGTALTIDQVKLLKRFTNTVIIVYDPDEAGETASIRNMDIFISEEVNVYIAELPAGFDPDGAIRKLGTEEFIKRIKSAKNLFDYKFDKLALRFNITTPQGKTGIANEMLPTIARINNAVMRSSLVKKLAEKISVDEDALKTELKKVKPDYTIRRQIAPAAEMKRDLIGAEQMLLALMLEDAIFVDKVKGGLSLEEFKNTSIREVVAAIFKLREENIRINPARLINHLGTMEGAAVLVSEAVNLSEVLGEKEKVLSDCISRIKRDNLKNRLEDLRVAIKTAQDKKDENRLKGLIEEYSVIVKEVSA